MDNNTFAWLIPLVVLFGGAIGWFFRLYWQFRAAKKEATYDVSQALKNKKALIEEMMAEIEDDSKKEELRLQLDEVNTALLGLHSERLRRTLKDAGLPPEEALITDDLSKLKPEQVTQLEKEKDKVKNLSQSNLVWTSLAQANDYYHKGLYNDAKEKYDNILSLSPNNTIALKNRGNTYIKLGRYSEAYQDYNHALELNPDDADAYYIRGIIFAELERYNEALDDFNQSLELKPDDPDTLNNRGVIYRHLGRYDDALADFNRSLKIIPDDPDTLNNRGVTYSHCGRYDEALADYNYSLELKPDDPDTLDNRGNTYAKLERYDEAIADYSRSLELKPDYATTIYNLAYLFSLQGKADDALTYLEKAISQDEEYQEIAKIDKDFDNIRDDPRFKKLTESD